MMALFSRLLQRHRFNVVAGGDLTAAQRKPVRGSLGVVGKLPP
jgi:hypothetical protein